MSDDKGGQAWWQPSLNLFARFSAWIAFPVLIGAFIGKWIDKKLGSEPIGFIGVLGFAFVVSMIGLVINVSREYKRIEQENEKK